MHGQGINHPSPAPSNQLHDVYLIEMYVYDLLAGDE